jgi:hypothetical protein
MTQPADPYFVRQDVLGLALDLHMYVMGSYDLAPEHCDFAIRFLEERLRGWGNGSCLTKASVFDSAVHTLLTVAVTEAKAHRERWGAAERMEQRLKDPPVADAQKV